MEESSFFNDVDGDRIYYAEDFAEYFIPFFTNGIFNNGCQVLGNTNDMAVNVSTGRAFINGYRYRNKQSKTLTIENADGVLSRIDNIVIRLDLTNRNISTQVIKGSFSNNPVAPDLTRTSTIYDLRIAKVYIPAGTTEITQDLIEDCRFINNDCGNVISPIKTPDTEQLFIQMQAIFDKFIADSTNGFDTWFDSIKNQLDSDAAGNLQNQINNLNSNKVDNAKFDLDSNNLQLLANGKNVGDSVHIPTGITDTATGEEDLKIINNKGVVKFSLDGKTEQKTYTGKNILDYVSNLKASSEGLTSVINDDGSITTSGKPSSNYRTILNSINIIDFLEDGETYTFSQSKANDKLYMQMNAKKKDGTYSYYSLNDSTKSKQEIIVNKSIYETYTLNIQTGLTSDWGDSPLTITNKYMLCKGTDTADTSFEPYVGEQSSPNPNYPQKIENISGVENLFDKSNYNASKGVSTSTGELYNSDTSFATDYIKVNVGYYTVNSVSSVANTVYGAIYDSNKKFLGSIFVDAGVKTFKISNKNAKYMRLTALNSNLDNYQIERGNKMHSLVPYGSNYLQLEDRTENLIGLDNKQYRVNLKKGDKILAVNNGTTNLNLNLYKNYGDTARNDFFNIAANSQRSIVIANDSRAIAWGGTLNNIAWVVKGDKFIPYEPYKSQTINIDLKDNELCSDKEQTLKDELVIENGRAKINKKFGEYIFTGNEIFSFADSNARIKTDSNLLPQLANVYIQKAQNADNITHLFCTHYAVDSQNKIIKNSNKIGFSQWDNKKYIYFPADYSTIEEFKAKLKSLYDAGTPVIIQYPLAEPQIIDLGEVDFDLIEGNSTLNLEEDLKSNMSIKYYTDSTVVDLKKKVENKQNVILHGTTAPSNDLGADGDIYLQHN